MKLGNDLRRMRALKLLFTRCIDNIQSSNVAHEESRESAAFDNPDNLNFDFGKKAALSALTAREKEIVLTRIVQFIDNQLEQAALNEI